MKGRKAGREGEERQEKGCWDIRDGPGKQPCGTPLLVKVF